MTTALQTRVRAENTDPPPVRFVWLEITGNCQLECDHCYAESGPSGTHGHMTVEDWRRVIDQAYAMGVRMVQFIGGEPTLHPDFEMLVRYAIMVGMEVEVFTNLVTVKPNLWKLFENRHVRLATSYYTDDAADHAAITHGANAHKLTTRNIAETVKRRIPLRVGIIDIRDGQRYQEAASNLRAMGVQQIGFDRLREVGRGIRGGDEGIKQLCGNCASGVLAVSPDGMVWPCVFSRFLPIGNVRVKPLDELYYGRTGVSTHARLVTEFSSRTVTAVPHGMGELPSAAGGCGPDWCLPSGDDGPSGQARGACNPDGGCAPSDPDPCLPGHRVISSSACTPQDSPCAPMNCVPQGGCGPDVERSSSPAASGPSACVPSCSPVNPCEPNTVCGPVQKCAPDTGCPPFRLTPANTGDLADRLTTAYSPTACKPNGVPCQPEMGCAPPCQPYLFAPAGSGTVDSSLSGCVPNWPCLPETGCAPNNVRVPRVDFASQDPNPCAPQTCGPNTVCAPVYSCAPDTACVPKVEYVSEVDNVAGA